jgi:hypothetical protein
MEKVIWGVLGTAGIAKGQTIPGMMEAENCRLYAIAGRNPEKARAFREQFGFEKAYGSYEELLADNPYILAFKRTFEGREVYTVVNFSGQEQNYQLPEVEAASLLVSSIEDSSKGVLRAFEAQIYFC